MLYVVYLAMNKRLAARRYEPLKLCGLYWHFMDGVWIYLFLLMVMA
jgi:heme/copper-type cytochrome/quinol oxidase subunit 3